MQAERRAFTFIIICATLACITVAQGQNENTEDRSFLSYRANGGTRGVKFPDGSFMKQLFDNVRAWHEDAELSADEGIYKSDPSMIVVYGSAAFMDSVRHLNADTLIYYEKNREAVAIGNVRVTEGGRLLLAEHVKYLKDIRYIKAAGGVTVTDDSTNSFIKGMEAVFRDSTGHGIISGEPFLRREYENGSIIRVTCSDTLEILRDENIYRLWNNIVATKDSLIMTCSDTLEILRDENIVRLWRNVVVTQDSLKAFSELAVFNDSTETLILTGNPEIHYTVTGTREDILSPLTTLSVITGDTVRVYISEKKVSGAEIIGSAVSTTVSSDTTGTLFDRSIIESAVIRLVMKDDYISFISAEGTARSYYHRNYTEDEDMFVNIASGDTLTFSFDSGDLTRMKIYGYGGGIGKGMYYGYEPEIIYAAPDSSLGGDGVQGYQ